MFWNWSVGKKFTPANLNFVKTAYKSATEDRSGTTLGSDAEMRFDVGANETWAFTFNILAQCTTVGDFKVSVAFPSGGVCPWSVTGLNSGSTAYESLGNDTPTSASTVRIVGMSGSPNLVPLVGTLFNGATSGTVILYWSMNTTDGSNTASVRKGSHLIATRLD